MKNLIIANWKCNPLSVSESRKIAGSIKKGIGRIKNSEVIICPPFVFIQELKKISGLKIGAQDCFWQEKGAFTGEVSSQMLRSLRAEYVIVGHSERRQYFGETDDVVNKKLKVSLNSGLKAILCIGENKKERSDGKVGIVIKRQLIKALDGVLFKKSDINLSVAYEPIWAIGTGKPCLPKDAKKVFDLIGKILKNKCGKKIAGKIRIIYGGSVNSGNARGYIKEAGMQGLLVGGASLNPEEFKKIVKTCEK